MQNDQNVSVSTDSQKKEKPELFVKFKEVGQALFQVLSISELIAYRESLRES